MVQNAERRRLAETASGQADWQRWGPYLSERAWGTVREDYSENGAAWEYFPHDHARSRAYRWNEDGLAGFCDRAQHACLAIALWNEHDPILKERMFGLSNNEGNHGEDVKEYFFYLDNTPTHAYAKMIYKYPLAAFPYAELVEENRRRTCHDPEFELFDALGGDFRAQNYFDVFVEYAKVDPEDLLCRITVINRAPVAAPIHVLPHLWYRNTWSWKQGTPHPVIEADAPGSARTRHPALGDRWWYVQGADGTVPDLRFTENETNLERLFNIPNASPYVKDGINDAVVSGRVERVNARGGSKVAACLQTVLEAGATFTVEVRFSPRAQPRPFEDFDETFSRRAQEADDFYASVHAPQLTDDERLIQRQAFAGLLWSKQFYHFNVYDWLRGDPTQPPPPPNRWRHRNSDWVHLHSADVILMPDKWEYPWFASWDLAFHAVVMAAIDPAFAKQQIELLMLPRCQHPYGSVPAYEWDFNAVNPPVLAWAAWQIYLIERMQHGQGDMAFLESVFHSLVIMLAWWVNRKDAEGKGIFGGGFLGLDNIGVFDRDRPLPTGGTLEQSDGTGWMAMFQANMAAIAIELAAREPRYLQMLLKLGQHYTVVADVLQRTGSGGGGLWDAEECFYFDAIRRDGAERLPLKIYSVVGLVPLLATSLVEKAAMDRLPLLAASLEEAFERRPYLRDIVRSFVEPGQAEARLLSVLDRDRLAGILRRVLDETQFLSDYGVRSLSREHLARPYQFHVGGQEYEVRYLPGVSDNRMFGGNSNWRGPIWFPLNFLLIQALDVFARYHGDAFTVECPTGSGRELTLSEVAADLSRRLARIFLRDDTRGGRRAVFGDNEYFQHDPHWRDYIPFHEYFHGDTGTGLGAGHQTGWTALVALLIQHRGDLYFDRPPDQPRSTTDNEVQR